MDYRMALVGLALSTACFADDKRMDLAQKSGCLDCHLPGKPSTGPAYRDVAEKYKDDRNAVAKLIFKIKIGGSGVWGEAVMPPSTLNDEQIRKLAEWVLMQ